MVSLADSLVSTSARRLPVRKRPDLSARRQQYLGRSYWVVKDPVGLNYYRFQDEEYAILNMLDGQTSLDEIKERFEAEFPPQKITLEELQQFLGMLHRSGLIITGATGQGHQLRKRRDERKRQELLAAATNILCIRFKGFDPERFLNWLYPKIAWFFSRLCVGFCLLMAMTALLLVLVEWDVFQSKLPGFYQFFNPTNALLMAATLGLIKVVHEFGHGLSCKHFGGECHEMGVMILVLTPCLYCNVSDSWMLPSKWQRAAIGAAGMYFEVVIASICTFIWWFSEPGLLNNLCLNMMFVASVSTLLFNANPLLRYDGYYILSDLTEIPNLRQKASTILNRKLGQWFLGLEPPEDPFLPQRNQLFFALYSTAAAVYRWFVMASILWFMYQIFKPYHLEIIGQGIIAMSLYGLVVMPLYKVGKFFYVPGRIEKVKKPRMFISLAVIVLVVLAVAFVPLPYSVTCSLEILPREAEPVYVDVPEGGILEAIDVKPGAVVKKGDELAQLDNVDLDLQVARLTGQRDQYRIQLESLRRQRHHDHLAHGEISRVSEALQAVNQQLAQKVEDQQRLRLVAPINGVVLPPPVRTQKGIPEDQLPPWTDTPLNPRNLGGHLREGDQFCSIGDPKQLKASLVIDQADVEFVQEMVTSGRYPTVDIQLDALPGRIFHKKVTDVAGTELEESPVRLAAKSGGDLPTVTDPVSGKERPQSASYQAIAPMDDDEGLLRIGFRGRGKIHTRWQSLGQRLWRFVQHTFNFKL